MQWRGDIGVSTTQRNATPTDEVVLEVQGLETPAGVRDVSFELRRGEVLGLGGVLGSGRTEIARVESSKATNSPLVGSRCACSPVTMSA